MKIAYVTTYNAKDIRNWSGSGYYISHAIQNEDITLEYIGELENKYDLIYKVKNYFLKRFMSKTNFTEREPAVQKSYAKQVLKRLSDIDYDIIFSPETISISYLELSNKPIVFWTDATFDGMIDFYPGFSGLSKRTLKNGHQAEQLALDKCKYAIYSSEWAAKTAIDNYNVDPQKIKVLPFGANLQNEFSYDDITKIIQSKSKKQCNLLFMGVDWFRKGGDMALEVAKNLNEAGLKTQLNIVGCEPIIEGELPDYVKKVGFISKDTKEGRSQIDKLFKEAHFLILPSRAECFGIVFSEASSYGVPSLATNVGGIPTAIRNNVNGVMFPLDADANQYSKYILSLFDKYGDYNELARLSFNEYKERLNWNVIGNKLRNLLNEVD